MDAASLYYLGFTLLLFVIFAAIVARTYRGRDKEKREKPKFRMMDDEAPRKESPTRKGRNGAKKPH